MAAYPSHNILLGSSITEESGVLDDLADSGILRSRVLHSKPWYRFQLIHNLTLAQFNTLRNNYQADRRAVLTLTYHAESPAVTYSVVYTEPPQIIENIGGGQFRVSVALRGFKD